MDKTTQLLVTQGLKTIKDLGLDARVLKEKTPLGGRHAHLLIEVKRGNERATYIVEVKRHVTPATLGPVVEQLTRVGDDALLLADYITPPVADRLRAEGIAFIDAVGNAYLDRGPLLVWVKGQKRPTKRIPQEIRRAFQPTGLQVIFTLLCLPDAINAPYRELAKMAGVAHGTVGWVMADLQQLGFLTEVKGRRGTRKLFDLPRLLMQWVEHYARVLRPKNQLINYYAPTIEGWKEWDLDKYRLRWGGEPAGALLTRYLKPAELTIYGERIPGMFAAQRKFLREPLPGYITVQLRKPFWHFTLDQQRKDIVPPILVYADLLATGDARCIETAKLLYDDQIVRRLQ